MNRLQEKTINEILLKEIAIADSVFQQDGLRTYRMVDLPKEAWDNLLLQYRLARWWVFANQN